MSLQDKLDALRAEFETKHFTPEINAIMHKATADLTATGQHLRALKAGERAPAFTLPDVNGKMVSSAELLARGPLVLTFYRGVWCPYCNLDLEAIEATASDIRAKGASLVAISEQTAANSRKAQEKGNLSFPILVDQGGAIADAFGLRFTLSPEIKALYTQFGVDLVAFNGDESWTLPMPARYVIGQDGIVAYAEVNPDYTRRPDPSELMPVLDRLAKAVA